MKKFTNLAFVGLLSLFMLVGCENPVPTPEEKKPEPPTEEPTPPTPPTPPVVEGTVAGVVKFGINAPSDWTAKFSNPNVKVTPTSGKAGRTEITIEVDKKFAIGKCLISLGGEASATVIKEDGAPFGVSGVLLAVSIFEGTSLVEASGEFYSISATEADLSKGNVDYIKTINFSKCPKLAMSSLAASSCDLIDFSGTSIETVMQVGGLSMTNVVMDNNTIKSMSFKNCKKLKKADLVNRSLSTIDLTGCDLMEILLLNKNKLTSLPLAGLPKLQELTIGENEIESIDLSQNPLLAKLDCTKSPKLKEIILKQGQTINSLKKDDHTVIKYK